MHTNTSFFKLFFLFSTFLFSIQTIYAQTIVRIFPDSSSLGIVVSKFKTDYVSTSDKGQDVVWDFSGLSIQGEPLQKMIFEHTDTTSHLSRHFVEIEHSTRYNNELTLDTLYLTGYENKTVFMKHLKREILLHYPFSYGDKVESYYQIQGVYGDKYALMTYGHSIVKAEGAGMLVLPTGDSIPETIMLRRINREVNRQTDVSSLAIDSIDSQGEVLTDEKIAETLNAAPRLSYKETCLWFTQDSPFPIFETICIKFDELDQEPLFASSFFSTLPNDRGKPTDGEQASVSAANGNPSCVDESPIGIGLFPNPVSHHLNLKLVLPYKSVVKTWIYDANGRLCIESPINNISHGDHCLTTDCSMLSAGTYLMIIAVGETVHERKFQKR